MQPQAVLPDEYYLHNFRLLLEGVQQQYGDLLTAQEWGFIHGFSSRSKAAQQLFVRLLSRKGEVFRRDKLNYPEIPRLDRAAAELADAGLLDIDPALPPAALAALLTKPELLTLFKLPPRLRQQRRSELEQWLLADAPAVPPLPFQLYRLRQWEHLICFKLLFFGNAHQDLTEFVLLDLGHYRYEEYPLDPAWRLFTCRDMLDATLQLLELEQMLEQDRANRQRLLELSARLPPASPWPAVQRRRARWLNRLARELERHDQPGLALDLYAQSGCAPARERRARILANQGRYPEVLGLCREILAAPEHGREQAFAEGFSMRLRRKLGERLQPEAKPPLRHIRLTLAPGEAPVELLASAHFQQEGACFYCENSLINALFGLAFWEAIFAPVPGAFFNRYQRGPRDLFSSDFYPARRLQLEHLLQAIHRPDWPAQILTRFADKQSINNHLVDWKRVGEPLLELALARIPGTHLEAIFRRMLSDLQQHRSGFPDLLLFPRTGGYRMIEVKGPGDTLQENQKLWLNWFQSQQIPAAVCHVSWQPDPEP